jgi:tetratricopeptide (TPR) repeat protein
MKYYKKAIDYLEHTNEYDITGLTYLNIGFIYIKNELYNEPIKYLNNAINHFKKTNNIKYITTIRNFKN